MTKTILFACPRMEPLARKIADRCSRVELGRVDWLRFEDGFPNLMIHAVESIRGRDVAFLACFDTPGTILEQLGVIYELPRYGAGSLKIILPYFPTGTMERVSREGEIATAHTLARVLSETPLTMKGPAELVIFDIHALQERFYFKDTVVPRLTSAIPLLRSRLSLLEDASKVAIAFPDEGAWKRFGTHFDDYAQIICHKVRDGAKRVVTLKEGDPQGKHVVMVDDLVKTGGTLLECRRFLSELGARAVSAYVTHGVFPEESWRRMTPADFAHFWITDSCPATVDAVDRRAPFEVLSLAEPLVTILEA